MLLGCYLEEEEEHCTFRAPSSLTVGAGAYAPSVGFKELITRFWTRSWRKKGERKGIIWTKDARLGSF